MGKAAKKKRQQELQAESILNDKSLIASEISPKWSLFNKPIVHFFLIAIIGFLVYSNTFNVPFYFDDIPNIVDNSELKDLSNFWPTSGSRWLGFLTFALNYHFGGLNAIGYHVVNLAIHIFNAILVYMLVILTFRTPFFSSQSPRATRRGEQSAISSQDNINPYSPPLQISTYLPLFIALIFVAHPIQTQAVTYIVQRFTSLAAMFYLLSLVMYIKWRESKGQRAESKEQKIENRKLHATRYTLYTVSFFSAILAMKTKEISFTLPIIIVLYEFMFFEGKFKKRILYLLPLLLTMLIIPLSFIGIDKPIGDAIGELREASQETDEVPRWSYLLTQFRVIVTYIRLLFLPINQNLDYDYPVFHSFFNPEVFLSFLFLLLIFSLGIYLLYSKRYTLPATRLTAFGILWFFITLSVESSIIPIKDVIFEHRVYLPSVGAIIAFSIAIFYVLHFVIQRSRISTSYFPLPTSYFLLLSTVVIVLLGATYTRNIVWQDEISLWEDVVRKSPNKARSHYHLGLAYYEQGRIDEAIGAYETTLKINYAFSTDVYNNLGVVYAKQGRIDEAIGAYETALKIKPDDADIHYNLAHAYAKQGRIDDAISEYKAALKFNPDDAKVHYYLGVAYTKQGCIDEAISEYQIVLHLNPNDDAGTRQKLDDLYVRRETIKNSRGEK